MLWKKLKIVLDADDVLLNCNGYALHLLEEEEGIQCDMKDITGWGILGTDADRRLRFFKRSAFYKSQPALPGARNFLKGLMEKADVLIMSAVEPEYMGERVTRLIELFPFFPADHILLGRRKDVIHADVMLDDNPANLEACDCSLPVLYSCPWNYGITGVCRVQSYDEFLTLVDILNGERTYSRLSPKIVCIVGPSGSGKQAIAEKLCEDPSFRRVESLTTSRTSESGAKLVSEEEFEQARKDGRFLESAYYAGERYGTLLQDLDCTLAEGKHAVCVMDISGCLSALRLYPDRCLIYFVQREKSECVLSLLRKEGLSREELADRILAFDLEQKNSVLADDIVYADGEDSIQKAADYIRSSVAAKVQAKA